MNTTFSNGRRAHASGYTLIELVIAMGLGIAILLALTLLFSQNSGNQLELERTVRRLENARFSVDTLTEDVMHAGFYSDFNPNNAEPAPDYTRPFLDPDPAAPRVLPCATALTDFGWTTDPASGKLTRLPLPIEGIPAGKNDDSCMTNRRAGTEAIVIRRAETGPTIPWTAGRGDNLYIQAARCDSDPVPVRIAAVPTSEPEKTFNLRQPDCATVNNALRRLVQRTYYVATCNDCDPSDGIPTLKRVEMVNGVLRTTSIAEGVENIQFEFGVDTDNDGVPDPDKILAASAVGLADWQHVVAVRMHILTRSTQPAPGYVETRNYQLGGVTIDKSTLADGFKRTLLSTSVRLNNVGGRRD